MDKPGITLADVKDEDVATVSVTAILNLLQRKGLITAEEYEDEVQSILNDALEQSEKASE